MKNNFLVVLRHGETEWNIERKLQGQNDSKLTKLGIKQAEMAAQALKKESFDLLFTSDLPRCLKTAELVNRELGMELKTDKRLRERHFGLLQGLSKDQISKGYPHIHEKFNKGNINFYVPEGENFSEFFNRCNDFLDFINTKYDDKKILIVTHGGFLDCLMRKTMGMPLNANRCFSIFNTGINRFWLNDNKLKLDSWGDICHLKELASIDDF